LGQTPVRRKKDRQISGRSKTANHRLAKPAICDCRLARLILKNYANKRRERSNSSDRSSISQKREGGRFRLHNPKFELAINLKGEQRALAALDHQRTFWPPIVMSALP
jgi:hypothetical protein